MARTVPIAVPFSHPWVHKSALPKTAVDDSPGSSLLGLTTTLGAPLLGNQASNNQKTDVCGFLIVVPTQWVTGSLIILRARVKKATTLSTISDKVGITAKLIGDATVGSDLVTTSPQQVTVAYANYDFKVPGTTLRRGDHLWCTLTLDANDGGAVNTAMSCTRLWGVFALMS